MTKRCSLRGAGWVVLWLALFAGSFARADVTLPAVLSDGMVLQRDGALPFWGWADAGEEVTVALGETSRSATADPDGNWRVELPAMPAGGPHEVTVTGHNTITLKNVLVGEVWLCSGQSNMEWPVAATLNSQEELKNSEFEQIRLFHVPKRPSMEPEKDVQLAPYIYGGDPLSLPGIWEAQTATLSEPRTGMAVIADIGNTHDIHSRNKQEVGRRLALWALAKTYARDGFEYSGPLYKSMQIEGDKIRVQFDHAVAGLKTRDGAAPSLFAVAGADRQFVPAVAAIDGESVVVGADGVEAPVAVRFGWSQDAEPNLVNSADLPASPFRTDIWPRD